MQAIIKITANNLSHWSPQPHSLRTTRCNWNIVDMAIYTPDMISLSIGSYRNSNHALRQLRYFADYSPKNKINSFEGLFANCVSLMSITHLCSNYNGVASNRDMSYMFYACNSLIAITDFNMEGVIDTNHMFAECRSIQTLPVLNLSNVTNASYMFQYCVSIHEIPQLDLSSVINASYMFSNCYSLQRLIQLSTTSATNMNSIFSGCASLNNITQISMDSLTTINALWVSGCSSLSNLTISASTWRNNVNLDINSCSLYNDALDILFYSLPNLTSYGITAAITIRDNPGAATCDKTIAQNKGWTVIV